MDDPTLTEKIETILFLETEPVLITDLANNLEISKEECLKEISEISQKYKQSKFIWNVVSNEEEVQITTKKRFSAFIKKYFNKKKNQNNQISPAMLEVMSIILYRSPISKIEIEKLRGVNSDLVLRKLAIKGLIEKKEKVKNSGIFIYSPSLRLMKKLGVNELEKLPDYDKLSKEFKKVETFLN
jgi:segregation and condensation protein B